LPAGFGSILLREPLVFTRLEAALTSKLEACATQHAMPYFTVTTAAGE
jgi:hypothetical protein